MKLPLSLLSACAVGFSIFAPLAQAIELAPRFITTYQEGVAIRRPYFADGDKKYAVTVDGETEVREYEGGALFTFKRMVGAQLRLRPSPMPATAAFTPETLVRYRAAARKLLPAAAESVAAEGETLDALPINGWRAFRMLFSMQLPGGAARESVTFLNLDAEQQIVVQTSSRRDDWEAADERAFDIIRRWHELRPEDLNAGN